MEKQINNPEEITLLGSLCLVNKLAKVNNGIHLPDKNLSQKFSQLQSEIAQIYIYELHKSTIIKSNKNSNICLFSF